MSESFRVRLIFEGLVALVPSQPLKFVTPVNIGSVDVFFLDARAPYDTAPEIEKGSIRHPHFLWAEVDSDGYHDAKSTRKPYASIGKYGTSESRHLFPLEEPQNLSYELKGTDPLKVFQDKPSNPDAWPQNTHKHKKSIWWVSRPSERTGKVDHGIFKERSIRSSLLTIRDGKLFTLDCSNSGLPWNLYECTPQKSTLASHPGPRSLANQVALDLKVESFAFKVSNGDSIHLKKRYDGQMTTLRLRNSEGEALLGTEIVSRTGPDADFAIYYRHSDGGLVYPWILPEAVGTIGSSRKPCAPALFDSKKI
ncbi:MAG: hypothetical protein AAGM22_15230 [Acidobacteriota bacterium]